MKHNWQYKPLGEVADFISGYTPPKETISSNGEVPYYKVAEMNIEGNEKYLTCTNLFINKPKRIIPAGCIVFPKNGGAIFTNKKRILLNNSVVDLNTEALKPNSQIVTTEYLFYILMSLDLGQFNNGGGLPSINLKRMKQHAIPIPPLAEQEAIVARLDAAFERIDTLRRNTEQELRSAQQLFQSTLSLLLTPQPHWQKRRFGDVCFYRKNQDRWNQLRYIGLEHIEAHSGILLDTIESDDIESSSFKFKAGDVLYGRLRPYLQKVIIAPFDGCCSTEIFPIYSTIIYHNFLKYWFLTEKTTNIMVKSCSGCRMPRGNMTSLKDYWIEFPPLAEQQSIVSRLDALSDKVKQLQANLSRTLALCEDYKKALLREVFE